MADVNPNSGGATGGDFYSKILGAASLYLNYDLQKTQAKAAAQTSPVTPVVAGADLNRSLTYESFMANGNLLYWAIGAAAVLTAGVVIYKLAK